MTDQGQQQPQQPPQGPPPSLSFEQRVERFAQEAGEAGERIGRQAEAAGKRLAADPGVARATDTAARAWGLLLIAIGAWFFAEFTLGLDLPAIPWSDLWPLGLIAIGLFVIVRGMTRRSA
jgi:hypothetical protein